MYANPKKACQLKIYSQTNLSRMQKYFPTVLVPFVNEISTLCI